VGVTVPWSDDRLIEIDAHLHLESVSLGDGRVGHGHTALVPAVGGPGNGSAATRSSGPAGNGASTGATGPGEGDRAPV